HQRSIARDAPAPRDLVVHIDPFEPFPEPIDLAVDLAERGHRVVFWYAQDLLKQRGPAWMKRALTPRLQRSASSVWCGDLGLAEKPEDAGLPGCGLVCINFSAADYALLEMLGSSLASTYEN